jgi:hypothetical protein
MGDEGRPSVTMSLARVFHSPGIGPYPSLQRLRRFGPSAVILVASRYACHSPSDETPASALLDFTTGELLESCWPARIGEG